MKIVSPKISPIFCPKLGEDQKKGLHSNLVRFFCPKLGEDQKKKKSSSLKLGPIFCPKLGADQKQRSSPTICVLKVSAQLTKGGGGGGGGGVPQFCILFNANYTILAAQRGGPGPMAPL